MNAPRHDRDGEVVALLESSAIVSAMNRMRSDVSAAANESAAATLARRTVAEVRSNPQYVQRQLTAIALGTAIGVHVVLSFWRGARTDYLWLLVPAIVGVMTAVIAIMAKEPGRQSS